MHTAEGIRGNRRRRPIRRIVIIAIVLAVLIEPLVMYKALVNERAQRMALTGSSLANPAPLAGGESGR
jgi:hypothetical protein